MRREAAATGGPGLVRGRRDPDRLLPGDSLDWWRVEEVDEGTLLRLRAEMRVPGLAWLELSVAPGSDPGTSTFKQRKVALVEEGFDPGRITDPLYFDHPEAGTYVVLDAPLHARILTGEIRL